MTIGGVAIPTIRIIHILDTLAITRHTIRHTIRRTTAPTIILTTDQVTGQQRALAHRQVVRTTTITATEQTPRHVIRRPRQTATMVLHSRVVVFPYLAQHLWASTMVAAATVVAQCSMVVAAARLV